eukprot:scaffold50109_cov27-Prasinocladus_malaysianus.AAC.3
MALRSMALWHALHVAECQVMLCPRHGSTVTLAEMSEEPYLLLHIAESVRDSMARALTITSLHQHDLCRWQSVH